MATSFVINDEEKTFGIPTSQYNKITEATGLESQYNFPRNKSELAFKLSETYNYPLKQTFEFVDDYYIQYNEENDDNDFAKSILELQDLDVDIINLYFRFDLSVTQCKRLLNRLYKENIHKIDELDDNAINIMIDANLDYKNSFMLVDALVKKDIPIRLYNIFLSEAENLNISYEEAIDSIYNCDY